MLRETSKKLRREVYQVKPDMKNKFPKKPTGADLEEEKAYTKQLLEVIDTAPVFSIGKINERRNLLEEKLDDVNFAS